MTQLSPHFSLSEMVLSTQAARMGIDNNPLPEVVERLRNTAMQLEKVRLLLNSNAIMINSGYRCPKLEYVLCRDAYQGWCKRQGVDETPDSWQNYLRNKSHPRGEAVDFTTTYGDPYHVVRVIRDSKIEFDQCIWEFGSWTHISFNDTPRRQVLTIDVHGTRAFQ